MKKKLLMPSGREYCGMGKHDWSMPIEVAVFCHKCGCQKGYFDYLLEETLKTRSGRFYWRTAKLRRNLRYIKWLILRRD